MVSTNNINNIYLYLCHTFLFEQHLFMKLNLAQRFPLIYYKINGHIICIKTIARGQYLRDKDRKIICCIKLNSRVTLIAIAQINRKSYQDVHSINLRRISIIHRA